MLFAQKRKMFDPEVSLRSKRFSTGFSIDVWFSFLWCQTPQELRVFDTIIKITGYPNIGYVELAII